MPTVSEQYTAHPVHLDFTSYRELPETHAWPRLHDDRPSADDEPVPLVDLRHPNVLAELADACRAWGVFHVTGHGVPLDLLDLAESQCCRLFSLAPHHKLNALRRPNGVSGYGVPRISSFFPKLMWSEGFTIVGDPEEHASKLWPHDHRPFCEVMQQYEKHMRGLAGKLVGQILSSLGLPEEDERRADFDGASSVLQLNSYPACPDPDRAMGLAAHTDSSLLTILHQSSVSGLQVLRPEDADRPERWLTVPPVRGTLVVNVGDLLQILSNAQYKSVLHRAIVNRTHHRLSMAYIHGPQAHVQISPLPALLAPGEAPSYKAITWPEYLHLKAIRFDKALTSLTATQADGGQVEAGPPA